MQRLFCRNAFRRLEILEHSYYVCCPAWLPKPAADSAQSLREAWNSPALQEIRKSILDGSFAFCTSACTDLAEARKGVARRGRPVQPIDQVDDPYSTDIIRSGATVLPGGPFEIAITNDRSCNLRCPSCRKHAYVEIPEHSMAKAQRILEELEPVRGDLQVLGMLGNGDPFASKMCQAVLESISPEGYPHLNIHIITNGQLLTSARWNALGSARPLIRAIDVSVDASSEATYALNRVGGSWPRLLDNLSFIADLRQRGALTFFGVSMVVQANNWREMQGFVALGERLGVDRILFTAIRHWVAISGDKFRAKAVHRPGHPEYNAFINSLRSDVFRSSPRIHMGDLNHLIQ
jgi:hypothetical protein